MSRHPAADTVTVALASPHGASTPPAHGWHAPPPPPPPPPRIYLFLPSCMRNEMQCALYGLYSQVGVAWE